MLERFYNVALIDHVIEICLQLFKGKFHYCKEAEYPTVITKEDCLHRGYTWENKEYNFDNLAKVNCFLCFVLFCSHFIYFPFFRGGGRLSDKPAIFSFLAQLRCHET